MKIEPDKAIEFIEKNMEIELYEYQKLYIKELLKGKQVFMPRGGGTTTCLYGLGKFLIDVAIKNNPEIINSEKYDFVIPLQSITDESNMLNVNFLNDVKNKTPYLFKRDFDPLEKYEVKNNE